MAFFFTKSLSSKLSNTKYLVKSSEGCKARADEKTNILMQNSDQLSSLSKEMICRVCTGKAHTHITSKIDDTYDVLGAIRTISNVMISIDDLLPKYVCNRCLEHLKIALDFKKCCESSHDKFLNMLSIKDNLCFPSNSYVKHDFQSILHQMEKKGKAYKKIQLEQETRRSQISLKQPKQKTFKCSTCNKSFDNKESLTEHGRVQGCGLNQVVLNECDNLVQNVASHRKPGQERRASEHRCPHCDKVFTVKARLNIHMMVHTDTFRYFCDLCEYKCKHKYYLVMHMRTHTGEKPYRCPHCAAAFLNPSNLNKHKLMHQEKQFKCETCEKAFRTTSTLREHQKAVHMNIKYSCNFCSRDFKYRCDLRKHEVRNHNRTKRNYIGGEPTYKLVERMNKSREMAQADNTLMAQPLQNEYIEKAEYILTSEPMFSTEMQEMLSQHVQPMQIQHHVQLQQHPEHQIQLQLMQPQQIQHQPLQLLHSQQMSAQNLIQSQAIQIPLSDLEFKKDEMKIYEASGIYY